MERWAEHYQELYSKETIVTDTAVENTSPLPVIEELDNLPNNKEFSKAIDSLASSKAPGNDGIPQRSSRQASRTSSSIFTNSCHYAGRKKMCLRTCEMPTPLGSTKTKATAVIATTMIS